jgi:hypothetical protein
MRYNDVRERKSDLAQFMSAPRYCSQASQGHTSQGHKNKGARRSNQSECVSARSLATIITLLYPSFVSDLLAAKIGDEALQVHVHQSCLWIPHPWSDTIRGLNLICVATCTIKTKQNRKTQTALSQLLMDVNRAQPESFPSVQAHSTFRRFLLRGFFFTTSLVSIFG